MGKHSKEDSKKKSSKKGSSKKEHKKKHKKKHSSAQKRDSGSSSSGDSSGDEESVQEQLARERAAVSAARRFLTSHGDIRKDFREVSGRMRDAVGHQISQCRQRPLGSRHAWGPRQHICLPQALYLYVLARYSSRWCMHTTLCAGC
jgi:hypothetical protein